MPWAIRSSFSRRRRFSDVILEIADDLANGCQMSEYGDYRDPVWIQKYIKMRRPKVEKHYVFFWHEYEENGYLSNWYPCKFIPEGGSWSISLPCRALQKT